MITSKKGACDIDKACHGIFDRMGQNMGKVSNMACGKCGTPLRVYYCEERLYMVSCINCDVKALVKAGNPQEACAKSMAWPVCSDDETDECQLYAFWNTLKINDSPVYTGKIIDYDCPSDVRLALELPIPATDGSELTRKEQGDAD